MRCKGLDIFLRLIDICADSQPISQEMLCWRSNLGRTALHVAVFEGLDPIVSRLLLHLHSHRLLRQTSSSGFTCLHFAAGEGHFTTMLLLIEYADAAYANRYTRCHMNTLHTCDCSCTPSSPTAPTPMPKRTDTHTGHTHTGHTHAGEVGGFVGQFEGDDDVWEEAWEGATTRALLLHQAENGATCLHSAASSGHERIARAILERAKHLSIDLLSIPDVRGMLAADIAGERGHSDLEKLLRPNE